MFKAEVEACAVCTAVIPCNIRELRSFRAVLQESAGRLETLTRADQEAVLGDLDPRQWALAVLTPCVPPKPPAKVVPALWGHGLQAEGVPELPGGPLQWLLQEGVPGG